MIGRTRGEMERTEEDIREAPFNPTARIRAVRGCAEWPVTDRRHGSVFFSHNIKRTVSNMIGSVLYRNRLNYKKNS